MRPDKNELIRMLSLTTEEELQALYKRAYEVKKQYVGTKVYFRGIIELSNICSKNCYYCGIRSGNPDFKRYTISMEEALAEAKWCLDQRYGSLVIQAGERTDKAWTDYIEELLRGIKKLSGGKLGITLSLGEQSEEVYKRWFDAGAHRYLLRIETSNPELYKTLHPADHDFEHRKHCLTLLRNSGYQVGTGIMVGLPGQSIEDIANDILFFYDRDIDMLGMGPYIPHHGTPLKHLVDSFDEDAALKMGLKLIASCRIALKDVNIATTTALQALHPEGREMGLLAGANVLMPNITDTKYREGYQLYEGKPCLDENADQCISCLSRRIESIGESIGFDEWGDSQHFAARTK
ncbi:MAG: [FeFe] hydrogenase H-cluster radical SAM maturase HydE [Candidatus Cloacimonadales bacterium]|jgi:biotin synthase|nr:[FeFe] hydrogenase H-cluster radical SAM maturase HydE [Candidatus Cloacimonadota bacterium]MDY0380993.1 [FeFe] hydrogenase H-cluster radical SAM maturase HydE [Candidatus Cloacimonadaceae bacterium]MCB5256390.1 [FeFe] hydrogenase H-cluster radical SAM maturase HydE [Candidatus Cloacimonadota bacterium]MCB5263336.1 [FeFe] hydrogenase H-cluster radical SAM maturase HydE [Candidatus Cloacimonadota bacterium]MCB5276305.1 [FeFe] hydrogenase H-cluster radical SAM maturase HydE [Candidatus Cloacim